MAPHLDGVQDQSVLSLPRTEHRPRPIRYLDLERTDAWTFKVYGISADAERPSGPLVQAGVAAARVALREAAPSHYGVGFVVVHEAADFGFVLVDWWANANELHQRLFSCPLDDPASLGPHATYAVGCVWELAVVDFERRAWLRHVLANRHEPDLEGYLNARCDADV